MHIAHISLKTHLQKCTKTFSNSYLATLQVIGLWNTSKKGTKNLKHFEVDGKKRKLDLFFFRVPLDLIVFKSL